MKIHEVVSKKGSTVFLRLTVVAMALVALILAIFAVPGASIGIADELPGALFLKYPFIVAMYGAALFFYAALVQAWKLLNYIDRNEAFSTQSVRALRHIKKCGVAIGALFAISLLPLFYFVAQNADAPGAMGIGMILTGAPFVIAVFASLLEKLLRNAIDMKSENDLTV